MTDEVKTEEVVTEAVEVSEAKPEEVKPEEVKPEEVKPEVSEEASHVHGTTKGVLKGEEAKAVREAEAPTTEE